jgi:hypothetical protein
MDLIDEIVDFYVENSFQVRWLEIEFYHALAKRVSELLVALGGNKRALYDLLRLKTGKNKTFWDLLLKFYEAYPDLNKTNWDKSISWSKIKASLMPRKPVSRKVHVDAVKETVEKHIKLFSPDKGAYWEGRIDEAKAIKQILEGE